MSEVDLVLRQRITSFGSRVLVGLPGAARIAGELGEAAQEATDILKSSAFPRLTIAAQVAAIVSIYNTSMSIVLRESIALADLIAEHFSHLLLEEQLTTAQAMRLYDCLYGLYFAGAESVSEMRRFDTACVLPFDSYLNTKFHGIPAVTTRTSANEVENICYFCHCAHFDKGNAVSPIMASLARSHAARGDRKVYLYCVQWVNQDFVDSFAGSGVIVRQFQQDWAYDKCDGIVTQLTADKIDVAITDLNSSIASYVFSRRAAPLQMWIVMAFPYWSLSALDWVLLPVLDYQPEFGIAADRYSSLGIKQEPTTLIQACDEVTLRAARAKLPDGAFVFAVFSRLIKAPPAFLEVIHRILREEPRAHILIVGTGDPRAVYEFVGNAGLGQRVTFIHGNVDLNVYGRVIDVMFDTSLFMPETPAGKWRFMANRGCRCGSPNGGRYWMTSAMPPSWRKTSMSMSHWPCVLRVIRIFMRRAQLKRERSPCAPPRPGIWLPKSNRQLKVRAPTPRVPGCNLNRRKAQGRYRGWIN